MKAFPHLEHTAKTQPKVLEVGGTGTIEKKDLKTTNSSTVKEPPPGQVSFLTLFISPSQQRLSVGVT